jgi:hypothetical protein
MMDGVGKAARVEVEVVWGVRFWIYGEARRCEVKRGTSSTRPISRQ